MMIEKLFNNRYEIKEKLGAGGTAVVYKGYDVVLGRLVTIKILREEYASDAEFIRRFRREAQAVASLSHGNIVSVYDVGFEENLHFIVMEYVEGETLKDYIKRKGALPIGEAVNIIGQILDAVSYAHEHGIIHRDIKPQNILFAKDGRIKVTDFGIAVGLSEVTQTYTTTSRIMGSVHYISPEQVQGHAVNEKSDIYSVGVVFYEMLTGVLPFVGDSPINVAMQHIQGELQVPHQINPQVPVGLSYVVMRAMRKNPEMRFASAQEMKESILSVYEGINTVYQHGYWEPETAMQHTMEIDPEQLNYKQDNYRNGDLTPRPQRPTSGSPPARATAERSAKGKKSPKNAANAKRGKRKLNNKNIIILVSIVLVIVLFFVGFQIIGALLATDDISVPNVVGMTVEQAQEELKKLKLLSTVVYRTDELVPKDQVITQSLPEGQKVKENRSIELTVSQGPKEVEVPDLLKMDRKAAESALLNRMLEVEVTEEYHTTVPQGQVISQSPEGGEKVPEHTTVYLKVSKGSKPSTTQMPNLVGSALADAQKTLDERGIFVGNVKYEKSTEYSQGIVIAQSIAKDTTLEQGDATKAVDLTVSEGPGPVGTVATVEYTVPSDGAEHTVRIVVDDTRGTPVEEYNAKHSPGDLVQKDVVFYESGTITIFLDNVEVYAKNVP